MELEELAKEFLEEFFRLGRYTQSREISHSMRGEAFLLMYLWKKKDGASPGELGKVMKTSTARIAAALNNMERKELVVRKADKKDRRKTCVELTEKGKIQAQKWHNMPLLKVSQLMERLGEEDAKQMVHILKRINEIMPQMESSVCADTISKEEKNMETSDGRFEYENRKSSNSSDSSNISEHIRTL